MSTAQKPIESKAAHGFEGFDEYVTLVEAAAQAALDAGDAVDSTRILDGQPSRRLRQLVALDRLRETGAFFTGSYIRDGAFASRLNDVAVGVALDPACGAGDLLLAWAARLPAEADLTATVLAWSTALRGVDVNPVFVRLTRARLVLAAARRQPRPGRRIALGDTFGHIAVGDGLAAITNLADDVDCLLLNPPFSRVIAPVGLDWTSGRTTAAVFFADAAATCRPGVEIVAILPDVIRTGSRHTHLRDRLEARIVNLRTESLGRFDGRTDIDVMLLSGATGNGSVGHTWWPARPDGPTLPPARIEVGAVVPHRDPHRGPWSPFLHALNIADAVSGKKLKHRRYTGQRVTAPFVVIRRTSRPGERPRARADVIVGGDYVVENHLIVVTPLDGSMESCEQIAVMLESSECSVWLDARCGGRHLTTSALGELWNTTT